MASRTGAARSRSAASPPTMRVSFPPSARLTLPDTGASRTPAPRARIAASWPRSVAGGTVEQSMRTAPGRAPAARPSGPPYTASTAAPSASIESATSTPAETSAGRSATVAPSSSASRRAASDERFQTTSSNPAVRRARAMALPIRPVPRSPTAVTSSATSLGFVEPPLDRFHDPLDRREWRGPPAPRPMAAGCAGS